MVMTTATANYEKLLQGVQEPLRSIALQIIAESGGKIGVTAHGGFRDRAQQQKMYNDYLNGGNLAARPGHSMHERGLAVDFKTTDYGLLAKLATAHGLVNSVHGEPWHYTMGDGLHAEGSGTDSLPQGFNPGEAPEPHDALANRLNAVFSMLGGNSATGETQPAYDPALYENLQQPDIGVADQAVSAASDIANKAVSAVSGLFGHGSKGQYEKYAAEQFSKFGWDKSQLPALIELWDRESGWNPQADNPHSTAAGIAQKLQSVHGSVESSPLAQINWGLQYIAERYGSPSAALAFHNRHNFY